jgi:pyridinium-3,5-bisthiocarboxylic acid mononucleotide nickel chelatase
MKIAFFDCFSGVSGDMLIGALLDAGLDIHQLEKEIAKLGLPNVRIKASDVVKQNIAATKFDVIYEDQKHHRHLKDLNALVENTAIDIEIQQQAKEVFLKIAEAEAKIHAMPLEKVHFHEVGAIDTIVDVVGALVGLRLMGVEKVFCSRLNVGSGFVTFSHGKFPVPAPATAEILKHIPTYSTDSKGELVTPTGAAIMAVLTNSFGDMPHMKTTAIGYGAGTKDFDHPNVLRVFIGEPTGVVPAGESAAPEKSASDTVKDEVLVMETNIDDMNPQWYDHVIDRLYDAGALEVFLTQIQMKKNRPGTKLTILARELHKNLLLKIIFSETTSIGVRMRIEKREILERVEKIVSTPYGDIKAKISYFNGEQVNIKAEYDDLKRIANETNTSVKQLVSSIQRSLC